MFLYLFGEDRYRINQESLLEQGRFFGEEESRVVVKFDPTDRSVFSWKSFLEALADTGLFVSKKCLILDGVSLLVAEDQGRCVSWLKNSPMLVEREDILCIFLDDKPDKRTSLYKTLTKKTTTKEFPLLEGRELLRYVRDMAMAEHKELSFDPQVIPMVIEVCGSDLFCIANELKKLVAYAGKEKRVTLESAKLLGVSGVFEEIFGALDAVGRGDKKNALRLLRRQIQKGEHPIKVLATCAYQIRTMIVVGECLDRGIVDAGAVAREAKLHPFVAGKTMTAVRAFGVSRAKKAFALLGRLDVAIKTGKIDAELAVEEFVLRS